uniref:Predicted GPI-anchored protein 58 n=1 Tax=Tursiops truncatus TaxID=9739 RepID=A0A6J3R1N5_TURTR|nr:predicted GPI-anchored protein 58 [Tursiops truncatus]
MEPSRNGAQGARLGGHRPCSWPGLSPVGPRGQGADRLAPAELALEDLCTEEAESGELEGTQTGLLTFVALFLLSVSYGAAVTLCKVKWVLAAVLQKQPQASGDYRNAAQPCLSPRVSVPEAASSTLGQRKEQTSPQGARARGPASSTRAPRGPSSAPRSKATGGPPYTAPHHPTLGQVPEEHLFPPQRDLGWAWVLTTPGFSQAPGLGPTPVLTEQPLKHSDGLEPMAQPTLEPRARSRTQSPHQPDPASESSPAEPRAHSPGSVPPSVPPGPSALPPMPCSCPLPTLPAVHPQAPFVQNEDAEKTFWGRSRGVSRAAGRALGCEAGSHSRRRFPRGPQCGQISPAAPTHIPHALVRPLS